MFGFLGLAASFATITWTALTDPKHMRERPSESLNSTTNMFSSLSQHPWSKALWNRDNQVFLGGLACGLGLQYLYGYIVRHAYFRRVVVIGLHFLERGQTSTTNRSSKGGNDDVLPLRIPISLLQLKDHFPSETTTSDSDLLLPTECFVLQGSHLDEQIEIDDIIKAKKQSYPKSDDVGFVCQLVAPNLAHTRKTGTNLHISIIVLQANCELPPLDDAATGSSSSSSFVEFYYVLSGSGCYSQQGLLFSETQAIATGDAFVVDPLNIRWIANKPHPKQREEEDDGDQEGATIRSSIASTLSSSFLTRQPLVLLRVTDGGSMYSKRQFNTIQRDPNVVLKRANSVTASITQGLAKVQKVAKEYAAGSSKS